MPHAAVPWRAMARARTRAKRSFALLIALCILLLLLQLNQWLPGVWKGGGEGGFRSGGDMGLMNPERGRDQGTPSETPGDTGRVEAPTEPPKDWPPRAGLRIQVRAPDGSPDGSWRLGVGGRGSERHEGEAGGTAVRDKRMFNEGFRVRAGQDVLRHRHGLDVPATHYVVHRPSGAVPRVQRPAPVKVEVVDPASGEPIAGAQVSWLSGGLSLSATTDARGKAQVKGEGDAPFQVRVQKEGRVDRTGLWVRPRKAGGERIELPVSVRKRLTFRWPDRRKATITRAAVYGADGSLLVPPGERTPGSTFSFDIAEHEIDGATLAIRASATDVEGYRVSMPLRGVGAEMVLPVPRTLRVVARDVRGEPMAGAEVVVSYECLEGNTAAPLKPFRGRTNRAGEVRVSLPPGHGCYVTVQRGSYGPATRRIAAVDGGSDLEVVLTQGLSVPVLITSADKTRNTMGVRVVRGWASAKGVRIAQSREQPQAFAQQALRVGPFPPGPVELYAGAHGHAWQARIVDAAPAMGAVQIQLARGYPLMFVVEDAFGVPIAGASIEVSATGDGDPIVLPPDTLGWQTDAQGRAGIPGPNGVSGTEVPDGTYEARVSAPGYGTQVIRGLRPSYGLHFVTLLEAAK